MAFSAFIAVSLLTCVAQKWAHGRRFDLPVNKPSSDIKISHVDNCSLPPSTTPSSKGPKPFPMPAVNYHFTRQCNYNCGFCFHTAKTSHVEKQSEALRLLDELRAYGCRKINFAGGEPFLEPKLLGAMVKHAKEVCQFESVSIISNASKITSDWFETYGQYLDILGVSCDAIEESINIQIGRGKGKHIEAVEKAARLCQLYNVLFKLNTVVNAYNAHTDMSSWVNTLPGVMRWKVFQVLPLDGENSGTSAKRDVTPFLISDDVFQQFLERNRRGLTRPEILKEEDNDTMRSSYILVDEFGCFLDSSQGGKTQTQSILKVGVHAAFEGLLNGSAGSVSSTADVPQQKGFDMDAFKRRDGDYTSSSWSKDQYRKLTTGAAKSSCGEHCGSGGSPVDVEDLIVDR